MSQPAISLGVPLMDADHAALEDLLATAPETDDQHLPDLLVRVEAETRAHFQREEALMQERALAVLSCHTLQHHMYLEKFRQGHEAVRLGDMAELRRFLTEILPALLINHVNTADRVTAGMLLTAPLPA